MAVYRQHSHRRNLRPKQQNDSLVGNQTQMVRVLRAFRTPENLYDLIIIWDHECNPASIDPADIQMYEQVAGVFVPITPDDGTAPDTGEIGGLDNSNASAYGFTINPTGAVKIIFLSDAANITPRSLPVQIGTEINWPAV